MLGETVPKLWDMPNEEAAAYRRQWTGFEPGLPPVLVSAEGKPISIPEEWFKVRRQQIMALFGNLIYGVVPPPESPIRSMRNRPPNETSDRGFCSPRGLADADAQADSLGTLFWARNCAQSNVPPRPPFDCRSENRVCLQARLTVSTDAHILRSAGVANDVIIGIGSICQSAIGPEEISHGPQVQRVQNASMFEEFGMTVSKRVIRTAHFIANGTSIVAISPDHIAVVAFEKVHIEIPYGRLVSQDLAIHDSQGGLADGSFRNGSTQDKR